MASVVAFPKESAVNRTRKDANHADLDAEFEIDEQRHRNRVNLFAPIVVVFLIAVGWWIVNSLAGT